MAGRRGVINPLGREIERRRQAAYLGIAEGAAMRGFLSDRTRNFFDGRTRTLRVSKLFDRYGEDFAMAGSSVAAHLAPYADSLADDAAERDAIRSGAVRLRFTDYDWDLNDAGTAVR